MKMLSSRRAIFLIIMTATVVSCSSSAPKHTASWIDEELQPLEKVIALREIVAADPEDIDARLLLRQSENNALEFYYSQGLKYFESAEYQLAIESYRKGLQLSEYDYYLNYALAKAEGYKNWEEEFVSARFNYSQGNDRTAKNILEKILNNFPSHDDAKSLLAEINKKISTSNYISSAETITLQFADIDFPSALNFLGDSYGINFVFDQTVKENNISLDVEDVSFYTALRLLLEVSRHSYKVIDTKTVLIFADSRDRHLQFDELVIQTFQLQTVSATDMSALIKSVLGNNQGSGSITINEINNTLIVYDTPNVVEMVGRLIEQNDIARGEVALDVEIIEVNLSNVEDKGVDYGAYQISSLTSLLPVEGSISSAIRENTTISIPSVRIQAFKQDVEAKILANPSIRVLNNEKAKIHIGDRVPLRTSDILDATGQTRTTFEYQEIGIRLSVEPTVHANDFVTIKMELEVSSLGENLGTQEQQAFKIGTRNADTVMLVRNGETAILGGLIRGDERSTEAALPFLGEVEFIKRLFSSSSESVGKSDILLTITPKIIRAEGRQRGNQELVNVGTASKVGFSPYSDLYQLEVGKLDTNIELNESGLEAVFTDFDTELENSNTVFNEAGNESATLEEQNPPASQAQLQQAEENIQEPIAISFSNENYLADVGQTIEVNIQSNRDISGDVSFEMVFNPDIVQFVGFAEQSITESSINEDFANGDNTISVLVKAEPNTRRAPEDALTTMIFRAKRTGTSFLIARSGEINLDNGGRFLLDTLNSRIKVQ